MNTRFAVRSVLVVCCLLCLRMLGCGPGTTTFRPSTTTTTTTRTTPTRPVVDGPYVTQVTNYTSCRNNPQVDCHPTSTDLAGLKVDPCYYPNQGTCDMSGQAICVLTPIPAGQACNNNLGICDGTLTCKCNNHNGCGRDCTQTCTSSTDGSSGGNSVCSGGGGCNRQSC